METKDPLIFFPFSFVIFLLRTRHKLPLLRVCGNQWLSTWPMFRCNKDCWETSEGGKKGEKKGEKRR